MLNKNKGVWEPKRPNEVDYRAINWAADLDEGETISSFTYTVNPASQMVITRNVSDGKRIVSTLTGGKSGMEAIVTNQIKTSKGRTLETEVSQRIL